MKIFIVNGKGKSGKTTFEKMVQEISIKNGKKIEILSTIDYIKNIARTFGWNGEKELKDRKMLSDLKDLLTEWNDLPHKKVCKKIEEYKHKNISAIFIDSREPVDIERFAKEYQALTILVKRDKVNVIYGNHADDDVDNYQYDIIINNRQGLEELQEKAQIFYETFIQEGKNN